MVEWSDRFMMGIGDLDDDHQKLFAISKKIINTVQEGGDNSSVRMFILREGIRYLRGYFDNHAKREEAYMRQIGYSDYVFHKRLHDEFQDIQLVKYENIINQGGCSKEEILDFVGLGIGWLLEHISTADMAIVGRGLLSQPRTPFVSKESMEQEINLLFASTLNLDIHATVINTNYSGEYFGEAVYQQLIYNRDHREVVVMAGIEKKFLLYVAQLVYGEEMNEADALILSTFEIFSANFWKTFASRFIVFSDGISYKENHFLSRKQLQDKFTQRQPPLSLLFDSEQGKFFVSSTDEFFRGLEL